MRPLFSHFIQAIQVWVDNFFTLDTDDMWMGGIRLFPSYRLLHPGTLFENFTK